MPLTGNLKASLPPEFRFPNESPSMSACRLRVLSVLIAGLISGLCAARRLPAAADPVLDVTCTVDFGQDLGQSFGTLFELRSPAGQVVAGAGFPDVYNTRFRTDRHTLQFFVKPTSGPDQFSLQRLPHPGLGCGVYLFDFDGDLYAWSSSEGGSTRRLDPESGLWHDARPPGMPQVRDGDGIMHVGSGRLVFCRSAAWYNDRQILFPPRTGRYSSFYYAQGHLFFYHRHQGEQPFTRLIACPWTAEDAGPVDMTRADVLDTPFDREVPFAWGQWKQQVLTVSNMGGIYVFENGRWSVKLPPDRDTSYQVYSAMMWYDDLLLAHYPSGLVHAWDGQEAVPRTGWPPVLPGVARSARECQTLSVCRGDLMAGVWPWAELWRRDENHGTWISMGRLFSHPQVTDRFQHPYETEARRQGRVLNHWGQRVTGMIACQDALYLSTSAKGTGDPLDAIDFLPDDLRKEYGAVFRLKLPGHLAASIRWPRGPVPFRFVLADGCMAVYQQNRLLAETKLPEGFDVDLSGTRLAAGSGCFGPFQGTLHVADSRAD